MYDAISVVPGHAFVCLSVGMNVLCVCVMMFVILCTCEGSVFMYVCKCVCEGVCGRV